MAKKGGNKRQKRFTASKARQMNTKSEKWTVKSIPGPFSKEKSIPLGVLLRDLLGIGRNLRETKIVLHQGKVSVNGKKRRDYRFPVGLFDIISIEGFEKDFMMVFDRKGKLLPKEKSKEEKKSKVCRIEGKKTAKKGKTQLLTNDGRNILVEKGSEINTNDSIEIEVPSQKVLKIFRFEKGAKVFIRGGKHAGQEGIIKEIIEGSTEQALKPEKLVLVKSGSKEFQTNSKNIFVIGEAK
ncbi:MAG: 30S ribosomal protein S4e [Candidatus Diapherotrites archaeon]